MLCVEIILVIILAIVGFTRFSEIKKLLWDESHQYYEPEASGHGEKISEMQILFQGHNLPMDPWFNE